MTILDVIRFGRKVTSTTEHVLHLPNGGISTVKTRRMETKTTRIIEITTTVETPKAYPAQ